jgi:hypothetical protein
MQARARKYRHGADVRLDKLPSTASSPPSGDHSKTITGDSVAIRPAPNKRGLSRFAAHHTLLNRTLQNAVGRSLWIM